MLNSVVRISSAGDLLGTGSIISVASEGIPGRHWPYIITAHHVIKNQVEITLEVPDPLTHTELFPPIASEDWRQPLPGVDLAIAPFPTRSVERYQGIHLKAHFVPEGTVVPLGGQIYYLGVFAPLDVPMCRSASLGALDIPIAKEDYAYRADLVDCRSYGGFSGSPCFSTIEYAVLDRAVEGPPEPEAMREDGTYPKLGHITHRAAFCGIFTAHFSDEALANGVVSRYGIGVMLPCDYVRDALMTDYAIEERRLADKRALAERAAEIPPLENAGATTSEGESQWDRFEDLTRKLVQTPKPCGS